MIIQVTGHTNRVQDLGAGIRIDRVRLNIAIWAHHKRGFYMKSYDSTVELKIFILEGTGFRV